MILGNKDRQEFRRLQMIETSAAHLCERLETKNVKADLTTISVFQKLQRLLVRD